MLRTAAAGLAKGQPSKYYEKSKDKDNISNPVFQALKQEIDVYIGHMKRLNESKGIKDGSLSKMSNSLFELWNKYEPNLPVMYYKERLLEMGDFLVSIHEYRLALRQCYGRYLKHLGDVDVDEIHDVSQFKSVYFPSGFNAPDAGLTFRALMGKSICMYQDVLSVDPKLQNSESVDKCMQILAFLRLVTQVILPKEVLCWIVYNGTIHMYSVSRHLMSLGFSEKVLEYLLWASMCMESSVPLLAVKYLSWRATLYTAVCQCYYDCKSGQHGELFARRALKKINELRQLEDLSNSTEKTVLHTAFRQATVKMAIMIFKRSVLETRQPRKGVLRPRTRANLKDAQGLPWPRTPTEKLLTDMFEGSSARFLAILETLNDTNRRTLLTAAPAADNEIEILDVYAELFMAAQEIIQGAVSTVGGKSTLAYLAIPSLSGVVRDGSLIEQAQNGCDGVPFQDVLKLLKLAYCYEQFDFFDALIEHVITVLKVPEYEERFKAEKKALEIITALDNIKRKKQPIAIKTTISLSEDNISVSNNKPSSRKEVYQHENDEMLCLSDVLMSVIRESFSKNEFDIDLMVDATLFLWNKCKAIFSRYQTGSAEGLHYQKKMENQNKWAYILESIHQVIGWCGLSTIDPALTAEITIRLALVLETSIPAKPGHISKISETASKVWSSTTPQFNGKKGKTLIQKDASHLNISTPLNADKDSNPYKNLLEARKILELGLNNVSIARQTVTLADGKCVADTSWIKDMQSDNLPSAEPVESEEYNKSQNASSVLNAICDLHLELILMYHRVCLKLFSIEHEKTEQDIKACTSKSTLKKSMSALIGPCKKNCLSKALLLMQTALHVRGDETENVDSSSSQKASMCMLQESFQHIIQAQENERNLYLDSIAVTSMDTSIPPPPILLSRTDTTMTLKPAPFNPGKKVAWYQLFGRISSTSNTKVRLNDYLIPGTGEAVPSFRCELRVSGLQQNESYVFAVGAYTADGELIGGSVGKTSKTILASHPLPVLLTWAYLCQIAYQVEDFEVSRHACNVLWNHFVIEPSNSSECDVYSTSSKIDVRLTPFRLNTKLVNHASPVLLRQFLSSIFINVDISTKTELLYCDRLCDNGPLYEKQIIRLKECERMLIALQLSGWLNEMNMALQAIVHCYGLLAPLLYYKIPSIPVIQVLERCHAALLEISASLRQRQPEKTAESLHHMSACISHHITKVLRTCGQKMLANRIINAGQKLLLIDDINGDSSFEISLGTDERTEQPTGGALLSTEVLKKRKGKKGGTREEQDGPVNKELKALEAHMLKLSKQAQGEHELTGNEDPSILHAYIAYLPSKMAFREVSKFKRRTRYLEFFVQIVQKTLSEGNCDMAIEWCMDTWQWIMRRNEQIIGDRGIVQKQSGAVAVAGDDPKKFAAAMVEYTKEKEKMSHSIKKNSPSSKRATSTRKKEKYNLFTRHHGMSESARLAQEQHEQEAMLQLKALIPDIFTTIKKRKRFRKISVDEIPWRSQLNIFQGLGYFGVFLHKLELREKVMGSSESTLFNTSFMDQEWFTFETTGTLIVGWDGGPKRQLHKATPIDKCAYSRDDTGFSMDTSGIRTTGIEMAAAATTGKYPLLPESRIDEDNTPRTYISEDNEELTENQHKVASILTTDEALVHLGNTFNSLNRAIVLAHRGRHWTLLQNACRALWNCTHTALLKAITTTSPRNDGLISTDQLRSLIWRSYYTASDSLLDMLVKLGYTSEDLKKQEMNRGAGSEEVYAVNNGGASLVFDSLDNLSLVDIRWIKRMVLRTLQILFYEEKLEKLVDVALRFNTITSNCYAVQVSPLLIQGQNKLAMRMKGSDEQVELKYDDAKRSDINKIHPGAHIDPAGHNLYSGKDALHVSSVPLDITHSLMTLGKALEESTYISQALMHSRKLLVLYLSGLQRVSPNDNENRGSSRVDISVVADCPQTITPPNLKPEDCLSDIQISPLPVSQLAMVVTSYTKTIEILKAQNKTGLAAQAMHELGNIYYHSGDIKAAYRFWCEGLDVIMEVPESIHNWRSVTSSSSNDVSLGLVQRCGLWGCILGATISSKIAQYVLTWDLGLRMECCFLSGYFFKALFRSSLPHPLADRDYALYDIGEECEVTNLVPGIDLLSDKFRCDGRTLIAALRYVTEELARGRHNLFVLPLLTLYNYFTTFVCRDVQRAVDGHILKTRILTDLGLFTESIIILQRLFHGERLPQTGDSNFRQIESKPDSSRFDTAKPVSDPTNLKILETVLHKRLSTSLAHLYGPHITCQLGLVQAHLLIAVSNVIPAIPSFENIRLPNDLYQRAVKSIRLSTKNNSNKIGMGRQKGESTVVHDDEPDDSESDVSKMGTFFLNSETPMSSEYIKGTLLTMCEQILSTISEIILETAMMNDAGLQGMSAAELELVVQCKLELGGISQQRHHSALAAHTILSAMKMLQTTNIFKDNMEDTSTTRRLSTLRKGIPNIKTHTQFQHQDSQSRSRLDARLWLDCRLALVKSLLLEIKGMGDIKGSEMKVQNDLADCKYYLVEGIKEASALGDVEIKAEFHMQGILLDIIEGLSSREQMIAAIKDVIEMLSGIETLSNSAVLLKAISIVELVDLKLASTKFNELSRHTASKDYLAVQDILIHQLEDLGETIDHQHRGSEFTTPRVPMRNIYLIQLSNLAQVKLRIGYTMARSVTKSFTEDVPQRLTSSLDVLTAGLELNRLTVNQSCLLEADILLNIGMIQRQLFILEKFNPDIACATLLSAIQTSFSSNHDLGLIREAYLEIALVHLMSNKALDQEAKSLSSSTEKIGDNQSSVPTTAAVTKTKKGSKSKKGKEQTKKEIQGDREKNTIISLKCAAISGHAQRSRLQILGQHTVTATIPTAAQENIPEFAVLDLVRSYVFGKKKKTYANEIEEEMAPLLESLEEKTVETYADTIKKAKIAAKDISWVHLLGYQHILERVCSTHTTTESITAGESHLYKREAGLNQDVVRYPLHSGQLVLRLNQLHSFFADHLPLYPFECCAVYPPKGLNINKSLDATGTNLNLKSYTGNSSDEVQDTVAPSKTNTKEATYASLQPSANEVIWQWYQPSMNLEGLHVDAKTEQILLLYSICKKDDEQNPSCKSGTVWLPLITVSKLHKHLAMLVQKCEIASAGKGKKKSSDTNQSVTDSTVKNKKTRIKALSPEIRKDSELEDMFRQFMVDVEALFDKALALELPERDENVELPFDLSRGNLCHLEQLFDIRYGHEIKDVKIQNWISKLMMQ